MKTIGLLGGLSWHSTVEYYKFINEEVARRLGSFNSAKITMCSVNFEEIRSAGSASERTAIIVGAAKSLENAGSDFIVICANTAHLECEFIRSHVKTPILHIVDTVREEIQKRKFRKVGLLSTKMTVAAKFYENMLGASGIELVMPSLSEIDKVDDIIQNELIRGQIVEESRAELKNIIFRMKGLGVEAAILGCTELPFLIDEESIRFPCLDSTRLHTNAAVELALGI